MAIAPDDSLITALSRPAWREYLALTKPKVSLLIVFTAIVGMVLASPGMVQLRAVHAPADSGLHGLAHSMHAAAGSHWHEWLDPSGGRARARCALSFPGPGSSAGRAARPSHSNLSFLHHLPDGFVRRI